MVETDHSERGRGDIIYPVRCGPFQPYQSSKSIGNSIIPYVGEATIEYNFRQYQSKDSNADVFRFNGGGDYHNDPSGNAAPAAYYNQQETDKRVPIPQPRHMGRKVPIRGRWDSGPVCSLIR